MDGKIIFPTTLADIREGIRRSELRRNILRICARYPRTIHQLIHAPQYPGIGMSVFSLQSEINVSVELGECKRRGLLVPVAKVPDPLVPGGRTELLRTSLFAFLASPELCYLEQRAYRLYLKAWFGLLLQGGDDPRLRLFLAFPNLAHKGFYVADGSARYFGDFFIQDIPVGPKPMGWKETLSILWGHPIAVGWQGSRDLPLPLLLRAFLRRPIANTMGDAEPLSGMELFPGRFYPRPLRVRR
ncbi:MAG TPA: hypothetical protein ENF77_01160 [Candidatus Acetothermia bacterium]|nr:hypothetical protein [Candidatus Acetothermia bacterium]